MKTILTFIAALAVVSCVPRLAPPVAELRVDVDEVPLAYASSARIPVEWQSLRPFDPPSGSPSLFVHLLDSNGHLLRTFDSPLPEDWAEADDPIEIWQSALAEPLPAGSYRLTSGIHDAATGRRWRLKTSASEIDGGEYEIAVIEIGSTDRKTPDLVFGGDWLTPDEGQRHNPGRRWLGTSGSIQLSGTAGWSEVVLTVSMTALPVDLHRPVFEDGAATPRLVIRDGCDGGSETTIEGYGVYAVALRLDGREDRCAISLEPNYFMLDHQDFTRRSVGLESAYFRPSSGRSSGG